MSSEVIPAAPDSVNINTFNVLIELWLENFLKNLTMIREGKKLEEIPKKNNPCICIGAGPSLAKYGHLREIVKANWKHTVLCCDKELHNVLNYGIVPYVVGTVDGSPKIAKFYKHKIIREKAHLINAAFNISTHPETVKAWKGQKYWYVNITDEVKKEGKLNKQTVTYILHVLSNYKSMISTIGNVGSFLWNLATAIECDPIILVGYDFSEQVRYKTQAIYFHPLTNMYLQKAKTQPPTQEDIQKAMDKSAALHQIEINPDFISPFNSLPYYKKGEHPQYLVNPYWKSYREVFAKFIVESKKHTINCTGNGCLHTEAKNKKDEFILKCPNFEAMSLMAVLRKYA